MLSDWVKSDPDLELVGTASDGQEAIELGARLRPDVVTLDVEMPVCDGLTALPVLLKTSGAQVLMVSSLTTQGAEETLKALEIGAYDFVTKPQSSSSLKITDSREEILAKIKLSKHVGTKSFSKILTPPTRIQKVQSDKVIVIASSTGGPMALSALFSRLPKGLNVPILIVQHMPAGFTATFARRLDGLGTVPCMEANEGEAIVPGLALLAPGGKHMTVNANGKIALNELPTLHGTRPAADYLFNSAVGKYGNRLIGVVLTGMGKDGAAGAKAIVDAGGITFGQNEATSTVYGMPKAAKQLGGIQYELPLEELAGAIVDAVYGRMARAS